LVGDPGVLDGIGCVGVAKLSLNRRDIAGFLDEVPAHGVAGVMGGMTLDAGQVAYLSLAKIKFSEFVRKVYVFQPSNLIQPT
jgi:hypothetical protein